MYKQAQMEDEAEARITPIGEAELQNRDSKKRLVMLAFAPIGAFVLDAAARRLVGVLRTAHARAGRSRVAGLAMRVVGAVPEMPDPRPASAPIRKRRKLLRHNLIESIDAIRTMLLAQCRPPRTRVVMVTSAVEGEGKTTLA